MHWVGIHIKRMSSLVSHVNLSSLIGTKLKPLVIRSGSDASAIINTFAISMASLYPVMVLSYEVCNPGISL